MSAARKTKKPQIAPDQKPQPLFNPDSSSFEASSEVVEEIVLKGAKKMQLEYIDSIKKGYSVSHVLAATGRLTNLGHYFCANKDKERSDFEMEMHYDEDHEPVSLHK